MRELPEPVVEGHAVGEHDVKGWVAGFGVAVPRGVTAPDPESVEAAGAGLGPPLVLKAYGPALVHKSDSGAVRLGLPSAAEAGQAAAEMLAALTAQGIVPDGFLVEEQCDAGVEVIVGAVQDPAFGPVLLAGLGGVWTEVLHDTALRLCPVTEADARDMLGELRGAALLGPFRGRPAVDRDALVKVLLAVGGPGGIAEALSGTGAEFELNPVICGSAGAVAVDARLLGSGLPEGATTEPPGRDGRRDDPQDRHQDDKRDGTRDGTGRGGDFDRLFAPRGIVVVGASARKPNFGNMFLGFYRAAGFTGRLLAVHPSAAEIDGVPCIASLADAPEDIDYALVAVPAAQCPDVVRLAGANGRPIPFVQVMSGGFREMGEPDLEERLLEAARQAGTRLLGPNCMGVYSPAGGQTFIGGEPGRPGHVAVVSQSGGMAGEVIKVGERRGLRFSKVATVGNSADVTPTELLTYLAADPGTTAIGLYLEDPRDGRGLFHALKDVDLPVAALVGGRSGQGQRAAASHTGGMVSDTRVWAALARQTGITLVTSQDDLLGVLDFFDLHARRKAPGSPEVLVIGPSGGASVLAADVFDAAGLDLAALPGDAGEALRGLGLGAGTSLANPLEIPVGPRGRPDLVRDAVTAILASGEPGRVTFPDVVAHVNVQSFFTFGTSADPLIAYTHAVAGMQAALPDTRVTLVTRNAECAPPGVEDAVRAVARDGGIPVYRSMEAAAVAVAAGKTFSRRVGHGTA
ncbi:acetate--CoA ligase family protein [Actinomadura scrupuli]|uniref:acetate--CoA ligase family protein n=1 Tax=Actinomadura scrupuli TaxID=559629 RepID=UPI003D9872DF